MCTQFRPMKGTHPRPKTVRGVHSAELRGTSMKICCKARRNSVGNDRPTQRYATTQQQSEHLFQRGRPESVSKGPAPLLGRTIRNGKPADSRRRRRRRREMTGSQICSSQAHTYRVEHIGLHIWRDARVHRHVVRWGKGFEFKRYINILCT